MHTMEMGHTDKNVKATVYDNSLGWLKHALISCPAKGFKFTEGPVWHPEHFFLFSDTPANRIYKLTTTGILSVFLENSGLHHSAVDDLSDQVGSNGLAFDKSNNLLICQHGDHAIALLNKRKELEVLVSMYKGRPFNSPNDIIARSDGTIFFTDPPYGLSAQVLNVEKFQPRAGIYKYDFNKLELVGEELKYPNGLFFSADEKTLFVSSNHPDEKYILKYKSFSDGSIDYEGVFLDENADGMTTDKADNIYLATNEGILIVSTKGKRLGFIVLDETPSNLVWGGTDNEILFVTARSAVYFITKQP
ncbi:MAG: SMP-30/gluconolactonase/LRE family protein [Chitinophagaceae bacterium]